MAALPVIYNWLVQVLATFQTLFGTNVSVINERTSYQICIKRKKASVTYSRRWQQKPKRFWRNLRLKFLVRKLQKIQTVPSTDEQKVRRPHNTKNMIRKKVNNPVWGTCEVFFWIHKFYINFNYYRVVIWPNVISCVWFCTLDSVCRSFSSQTIGLVSADISRAFPSIASSRITF